MFRIMLLLCYSLIDTNTIPFYFSTVSDRKSRSTHSAVRTYRIISSVSFLILRVIYPRAPSRPSVSPCRMGQTSTSTSLMTQLVQAVIYLNEIHSSFDRQVTCSVRRTPSHAHGTFSFV